jgi:hypothetical protein
MAKVKNQDWLELSLTQLANSGHCSVTRELQQLLVLPVSATLHQTEFSS